MCTEGNPKTAHFEWAALPVCRWCVTGTPVGGDIADLCGQFTVLQMQPFTNKAFFYKFAQLAHSGSINMRTSAYLLLYMMSRCTIRHTKLKV